MPEMTKRKPLFSILVAVLVALLAAEWISRPHEAAFSEASAARHLLLFLSGVSEQAEEFRTAHGSFDGFSPKDIEAARKRHGVTFFYASRAGLLLAANAKYGVILILEAVPQASGVQWACSGTPAGITASVCAEKMPG